MWGDFETFYPLGLSPSYLSRSDNLVGDHSFANPVPIPGSEQFIRSDYADSYYFLTPALSTVYSPFGRALSVYQQRHLADSDTAHTRVFVTRGRGSFSNTTFTFQNYFGSLGNVNADGTFQKTNGLLFNSNSKLDRLRLIVEPSVGANLHLSMLYSLNRLKGSRIFFPDNYNYHGYLSDNYNILALDATYYQSDAASYSARLTYKNDDQKFDSGTLKTAQRFRVLEGSASHQRAVGNQLITIGGDLRFLRFSQHPNSVSTIYYNLYGSTLFRATDRVQLYGYGALRGSEELKPDPALSGALRFALSDNASFSGLVSHSAVLPQPEMQYLDPVAASFDGDTLIDYRLVADQELEIGTVESIEAIFNWNSEALSLQARGGFATLGDVAAWTADYDSLKNGTYQATELDREVTFASLQTRMRLSSRLRFDASVGARHVEGDDLDYTAGPATTGSIIGWYLLPITSVKVDITAGAGGRFRSDANGYDPGSGEDAVFITDTYLSFDLKKFHFFFNFTNVFDLSYTLNGVQQPGRSIWWGFNWAFDN